MKVHIPGYSLWAGLHSPKLCSRPACAQRLLSSRTLRVDLSGMASSPLWRPILRSGTSCRARMLAKLFANTPVCSRPEATSWSSLSCWYKRDLSDPHSWSHSKAGQEVSWNDIPDDRLLLEQPLSQMSSRRVGRHLCSSRASTWTMKACDMPLARSVLASRTARLLPRASMTTTLARGRICAQKPAFTAS